LVEDPKTRLLYLSVFEDTANVGKSLNHVGGSFPRKAYFDKSSCDRKQGLASLNHTNIMPDIEEEINDYLQKNTISERVSKALHGEDFQ